MRTFIENYLHFMKNCIRPHYEKLKPLKSGFIENSIFENNRDPCFAGFVFVNWTLGQNINSSVGLAEENAGVLIIKSPKSITIRLLMQLSQQKRYQTPWWCAVKYLSLSRLHHFIFHKDKTEQEPVKKGKVQWSFHLF